MTSLLPMEKDFSLKGKSCEDNLSGALDEVPRFFLKIPVFLSAALIVKRTPVSR